MVEAWTEWRFPQTIAYVNAFGNGWTDESNALNEDGLFATSNGVVTKYMLGQGYDFAAVLPDDAVILGIEQKVVCKSSKASKSRWTHRRIYPSAWSSELTNSVNDIPTSLTGMVKGGVSDTWGNSNPTRAHVTSSFFGAAAKGRAEDGSIISIDSIAIRVYYSYTASAPPELFTQLVGA